MRDNRVQGPVTVDLENGLHLVPCSRIAELASRFESQIRLLKGDLDVDAKTILDLMTLEAECGENLVLSATGRDAQEAVLQLTELFASGFEVSNGTDVR
ncbi:MAG: HPr family phosphocarrier protein [Planctomycetaceae bacterium]